ncbi:MAG: integrin alpha [Phycisphaerales bacterium]
MVKHHLISKRAVYTFMALIAMLLLSSIAHGGGLLFVDDDAPPGGDGKSWDTAYRFVADALVAAGKGQVGEIRVAQGVYQPDRDEVNPDGTVLSHQKISDTEGNFTGTLDDQDAFGFSVASLGDLDGDGTVDLAVGALDDDDGGKDQFPNRGAVWVLFLNTDGTVKVQQKISDTEGDFTGRLDDGDRLGNSVASLGDLDGDGVVDLAVGAVRDDDGGRDRGAVWLLFLNTDGTVKTHQKISGTEGGFAGVLEDSDGFGMSVASLGDLDGDRVGDLAVGAWKDDDGGTDRGAVWVLFLNADGTVKSHQKISDTEGGFTGTLDDADAFGVSVVSLGDVNDDGVGDLAVGAPLDDDGGKDQFAERGAVWVLFLNTNGTVKTHQKISSTEGGFTGTLDDADYFGWSGASLVDMNGDGVGDLAVGAPLDDDGGSNGGDGSVNRAEGPNHGAVWVLFLNGDGTVKSHKKISDTEGGFTGALDHHDNFGVSVVSLGDIDGVGLDDLAVGAFKDDDGGFDRGAVWVLFLDSVCLWDLDANGSVGAADLCSLLESWGPCDGCPADFDGDGSVGASDLLALLVNWGPCP